MERIFYNDTKTRKPSDNLAINNSYSKKILKKEYEVIARIYRHDKGIILGYNEDISDINLELCKHKNYEVTRRLSGGSAVIVDPSVICYSLFLSEHIVKNQDFNDLYKKIVIPLAKKLGPEFIVKGNYYIRQKIEEQLIPVSGHSMTTLNGVFQFDGIIYTKPLDMKIVKKLLNLRELREYNSQKIISMKNKIYSLKGKELDIPLKETTLLKSEEKILEQMKGISYSNINEQKFIETLLDVINKTFGKFKQKEITPSLDYLVFNENKKYLKARGHCFVDFAEPEETL